MKIANVLRRFSFEEWGGTESAVWNSAKTLAKFGHTTEILCTNALSARADEIRDSIHIRRFPYFYPHIFLDAANRLELDKKGGNPFSPGIYRRLLSENFDIVHCHAMGRVAKTALKAAHKKRVPLVLSFHGGHYDVPQSEFEEMAKPLKGTLGYGRVLEKLFRLDSDIVAAADGVICVGQNEYDEIKKRFPDKIAAYIPNGVSPEKFAGTPETDFRATHGIPKDRTLILCVSRIDYQKNQRSLVKLVGELSAAGENVHCAIVGFITSKPYCESLHADIATAGLQDRFTVINGLPPDSDELLSAYKSANLFALPSIHEPFGIVVLEAWSAGLPVIASNVGGLGKLVRDNENGCRFESGNIAGMVDAYRRAKQNAGALRTAAAKEVAETYSWDAVTKTLENFYENVLSHAR